METLTVEGRIHEAIDRLTAAEKRAARALLANYPTLGLAPVAEFAAQSGASAATVLRFIAQLDFRSYPDFQRALREELEERAKAPLQRATPPSARGGEGFIDAFFAQVSANLATTAHRIPTAEFEAACSRIAEARGACHLMGGRFTDAMAAYLEAHLRLIRPGVRRLDGRGATRIDQLLDIRPGDTVVIFDIRRYDASLFDTAARLAARRVRIILFTDEWISPISRFARIVIPCRTDMHRTWDGNTALFAVVEAVIARVTELGWDTASKRIGRIERE